MTALAYVLRRIFWGVLAYLLAVAGFLALLNGTLEATARGEIAEAESNAMPSVSVKKLDAEGVHALRAALRVALPGIATQAALVLVDSL